MGGTRTIGVVIGGRVQGVCYRVWTQGEARRRGLAGFVRNRADGRVEAVFSGTREAVEAMVEACRTGRPGARVEAVTVGEPAEAGPWSDFAIRTD
ncbi:acylphosphatase [Methylobacterium trifolii]